MKLWKLSGLAVVAGLLLMAAPGDRAQAATLAAPGIATAIQQGPIAAEVTEVHWRRHRHHHHGHRHWRRHHHHHGYRHHWRGHRHHHHHHGRRW